MEIYNRDKQMISLFYGTRPEYIKVLPVYSAIKRRGLPIELVKVTQHTSLIDDCIYDREVLVTHDGRNRLNQIVCSCLVDDLIGDSTSMVMVQGDTATAFSVGLNAFHKKIPIAHIEAGLRTHDIQNPYPEEAYRRFLSVVADYNFCVTEKNKNDLLTERVNGKIYCVGNTVLDGLDSTNVTYENTVLVTMHRRENQNDIHSWFRQIEDAAIANPELQFIFPMHPSPSVNTYKSVFQKVHVVEPMNREEIVEVLKRCLFVITDSGGIQEESSFFKKKSIVCRKTTERAEGLNTFSFLCSEPNRLLHLIDNIVRDPCVDSACPYGDGTASEKIAEILKELHYETIQARN